MFKVPEWENDIPKSKTDFAKAVKNIKSTKSAEFIPCEPISVQNSQCNKNEFKEKARKYEKKTSGNDATKKKKPAKKRKHNDYVRRVINENDIVLNKSELRELDEVIVSTKKLKLQQQYDRENCEHLLFKEDSTDKVQTKTNVKSKSKENIDSLIVTKGDDSITNIKSKMLSPKVNVASINSESIEVDSNNINGKKKYNKSIQNIKKSKDINGDALMNVGKSNKRKRKMKNDESEQVDVEKAPIKAKKIKFENETAVQEIVPKGNEKKIDNKKKDKFKKILEQSNRNSISVKGDKLRERMMDRLKAAQFRYLNEKLYTSSGNEAQKIFQSDPKAFRTYHQGYQQQVKKWPVNPLDVIVKIILKMPKSFTIADMGCGEASLSRRVPQSVRSFDLVSSAPGVEACDMAHTPLPRESVDVAVYCLALMGTELTQYLLEANRVLKNGGQLLIAEVESRFDNVDNFVKEVERLGFKLKTLNKEHTVFFFLHFIKTKDPPAKKQKLPSLQLKPCLYKKR